jgi:membrane protease YdiL (CAAX protease family)
MTFIDHSYSLQKGSTLMPQTDARPVTLSSYPFELLHFRRFGPVGPALQMTLVVGLYVATTLAFARSVRLTGKMLGYDPEVWILFVPITEEILFRGFILGALEIAYGPVRALVISSLVFGLWHLKNVFWLTEYQLIHQMLYTTLVFGPITAALALKTRTIWPGVILHYLNNFPVSLIG